MALGKIILLIVLAAVAFLVYTTFFANNFEQGLAEMRTLEEKNNAQEAFLIPITKQDLQTHKRELTSLKSKYNGSDSLRNLFDIKLGLVLIQQNLFEVADDFERANKISPNCSPDSKFGEVIALSNETKTKIDSVLSKRNTFVNKFKQEALLVEEISRAQFEQALAGVKLGLEQIQTIVLQYC